jgi:hypothetical protein
MRQRQPVEQAQHGVGAGRHRQPGQQPCAGFAAQRRTRPSLRLGQPARAPGEGRHQLRHALGKGLAGTSGVAAVEPTHAQADPDRPSKGRQVGGVPTIAAVYGPAHRAAIWAATTKSHGVDIDLKMGRSIRCHLFDPAARDRTLNIHALLYGKTHQLSQTPVLSRHNPHEARENQQNGSTSQRTTPT